MDKITIGFEGERDAIASLTWAQWRTWQGSRLKYRSFVYVQPLPQGKTLREVCDAVKWAYEEFESLRTIFPSGADGEPYQEVSKKGSADILIVKSEESTVEADVESTMRQFRGERIDTTTEFGAVFAVVTSGGDPTHLICAASHLAVDAHGLMALRRALDAYFSGEHVESSTPQLQPIERARLEQSEKGQQKSARALAYWREVLEKFPRDGETSRSAVMDSSALKAAAHIISKNHRVSTSAVYLASAAIIAGVLIGRSKISFLLPSSNRWTPEEQSFVGELVQFSPGLLESLGGTFGDIVRDASQASIRGYMSSHYDERALARMLQDLDEARESRRAFDFTFNDLRGSTKPEDHSVPAGDLRDAQGQTKFETREQLYRGQGRFLSVALDGTEAISIVVHGSHFEEISARRILLAIEDLVVGVAMGDVEPLERPMDFAKNYLEQSRVAP
ncbi:condensation domain-containing protein [Streptomyces sp. NPDC004237]|uniref:condensation domain-containing protein n=1 Tax=Streptomyces sp. NPDC004237 TaxID=3154455 RepID=UPI0033BE2C6F